MELTNCFPSLTQNEWIKHALNCDWQIYENNENEGSLKKSMAVFDFHNFQNVNNIHVRKLKTISILMFDA